MIAMAALCFKTEVFENKQKAKKVFCVIGGVCLALIMSLRHESSGSDFSSNLSTGAIGYSLAYEIIGEMSWNEVFTGQLFHYERGYLVFNKILSYISKSPQLLIAVTGMLQSVCLFTFIYKTSKKPVLSTMIYLALPCFYIYWSGVRQGIAISITMLAFLMIRERKPVKFILLVVLAWFFHSSAIIFLIAYPLYHMKWSSVWRLASVFIIPIVYIARIPLFRFLSMLFRDDAEVEDTGALTLFLVFVAIYIFLALFENKNNKIANGCTNLFWVACLVQAFGGLYSIAMRVGYFFMIYAILAIPEVLEDDEKNGNGFVINYQYKAIFSMIFFVAVVGYAFYTLYSAQTDVTWYLTNPYRFFWK